MIGCEFLSKINDALVQATGVSSAFGGINVIFAGDMAQLPPVSETRLSSQLKNFSHALSPATQNKKKGRALWLTVDTVVMLTGNNRQSGTDDEAFRQLLTRLRVGNCTDDDYALLSSRV
ncbi:hypothetical protein F5887DRAFT_888666, partial [Amanita rubescens]